MRRRIWSVYAWCGAGHWKAAEAVAKAVRSADPLADVVVLDILSLTTPFFGWSYPATYRWVVAHYPLGWGWFFTWSNHRWARGLVRWTNRWTGVVQASRFRRALLSVNPAVVVSTHFWVSEQVARLKRAGRFTGRLVVVVTDFRAHGVWQAEGADLYCVGSQEAREDLLVRGVPAARVAVTGIPVDPVFAEPLDRAALRARLGWSREAFTVLVVGSVLGIGPLKAVRRYQQSLAEGMPQPVHVVIVCGVEGRVTERVRQAVRGWDIPVTVYGFVENMPELLGAVDVVVTKSGGLIVAEALARGVPLLVLAPIPGQETENCRWLLQVGAGRLLERGQDVVSTALGLARERGALEAMRRASARVAAPQAAATVAKRTLELLDGL